MTVLAYDPARTDNARLIADAAALGYLKQPWHVLDPTYSKGRFWTIWRPDDLVACDLNPARSPLGSIDVRSLPFRDRSFDAVALDLPYKLNGTSTGRGAATCDEDYGVENYASRDERHALIRAGITESVRVLRLGGTLLVKCQDQVNGGRVRWQSIEFARHAEACGCRLVDELHVASYRAQPKGRTQQHARRNYSTALILRREVAP